MQTSELIDYAHPCMMAENALKELHRHALNRDYEQAIDAASRALIETRMTVIALRHMKEQEDAVRE